MIKNRGDKSAILIATLGTEPQVVTALLDLLRSKGQDVRGVEVLHTTQTENPAINQATKTLSDEFSNYLRYKDIDFHLVPLKDQTGKALDDVNTPSASEEAFRTLYQILLHAKRSGERVHLSIAGGRKTLSVFGMVAAQLLFDDEDCLWHLYSGGEFLSSRRLHPQPEDNVHLIQIPVVLWSHTAPAFLDLGNIDDPFDALERQRNLRLDEMMDAQRGFVNGVLSGAEERVVRLLVEHGYTDQQIAEKLSLSHRTVSDHLQSAYHKATSHWNLPSINRAQLVSLLSLFYKVKIRNSTDDSQG